MSFNLTGAAYGGNITLGKAGLAAGTTTTYTIATAFAYAIKGQLFTGGAGTNVAHPTLDGATGKAFVALAPDQACIVAYFVNAAGTVSAIQGPIIQNSQLTGGLAAAQFPQASDLLTPFAYALVQASTALVGTWLVGTNNWAGVTGLTAIFRDVMDYPAQPITG